MNKEKTVNMALSVSGGGVALGVLLAGWGTYDRISSDIKAEAILLGETRERFPAYNPKEFSKADRQYKTKQVEIEKKSSNKLI